MGSGGVPNRTIEITYERNLKPTGKPNSRKDRYNKNGKKIQSRWYDENGNAVRNRDYLHSSREGVKFPHDHDWKNGERGKEHLEPDYDNYF